MTEFILNFSYVGEFADGGGGGGGGDSFSVDEEFQDPEAMSSYYWDADDLEPPMQPLTVKGPRKSEQELRYMTYDTQETQFLIRVSVKVFLGNYGQCAVLRVESPLGYCPAER